MRAAVVFGIAAVLPLTACATRPAERPVLHDLGVTELQQRLATGQVESARLVDELIIRSTERPSLNAFITVDREGAHARAQELDGVRSRGETAGVLQGIPLVVKDNIHVAGLPNTAGTPALGSFVPREDNAVVGALREAGAIVLGKTNMHELAFGITSDNSAYGAVANPYNEAYFAGGSSGGTAAAIAAGFAPAGLGTDTGGSVRIPAALTGIVGFRPTTGRYDSSAVTPISHTRDTVGLMARSVADVLLLDRVVVSGERSAPQKQLSEIRLGVPRHYYYADLDSSVASVVDDALSRIAAGGVELVDVDPDNIGQLLAESAFPIALYEVVRDLPEYLRRYRTGQDFESVAAAAVSPDVRGLFETLIGGGPISESQYQAALASRAELKRVLARYFSDNNLDGMIFPTTPLAARPIEGSLETVDLNGQAVPTFPTYIRNTDPASIAGLPSISIPAGLDERGLPVGIEIDGPEGADRAVLGIAQQLEALLRQAGR